MVAEGSDEHGRGRDAAQFCVFVDCGCGAVGVDDDSAAVEEGVIDSMFVDAFFAWGRIFGELDGDEVVEEYKNVNLSGSEPVPNWQLGQPRVA